MENLLNIAAAVMLCFLIVRILLIPVRAGLRLGIRSVGGFLCLWLINLSAGITGLVVPFNAVTVLIVGYFGIPGLGLVVLLEML